MRTESTGESEYIARDMAKFLSPKEYNIRSLAYYQAEGGVYNEIITVLTQMRKEPKFRGLPVPAKSLNEACFLYDLKKKDLSEKEEKKYISEIDDDLSKVLVALLATAWEDIGFCIAYDRKQIVGESNPYLPKFDPIFERYMNEEMEAKNSYGDALQISDLEDELKALGTELKVKDNQLTEAKAKIDELQKLVDSLKVRNESKFDKALSRKEILAYIEDQRVYGNVNQIFEMLLGPMSHVATDEEYNEIVALRQKMIDASVPTIHNHNDIQNSNVFPGLVNNPSFPIGADPNEIARKAIELYLKTLRDGEEG